METALKTTFEISRGVKVPLENLIFPKDLYTLREVMTLVSSIEETGLENPIEINENNEIMDGVLRALAFMMMGKNEIPVVCGTKSSPIITGKITIKSYNIIGYYPNNNMAA
jgi:ParB-like chromosome segregation protein Spo0J